MRGVDRVLAQAAEHGWEAIWMHKLLILRKDVGSTCYLAQVLFRDDHWDYAITFHRVGGFWALTSESPSEIVKRRRDLFTYLEAPR